MKILPFLFLLLPRILFAAQVTPVSLEGGVSYVTNGSGISSHFLKATVLSKTRMAMALVVCGNASLVTSISVLGQSLGKQQQLKTALSNKAEASFYGMLNPPVGSGSITVTFSKPVPTTIFFLYFANVNQTNPASLNPGTETGVRLPPGDGIVLKSDFKLQTGGISLSAQFRPTTTSGLNVYGHCAINSGEDLRVKGAQETSSVVVEIRP